jgi:hypothetical protein
MRPRDRERCGHGRWRSAKPGANDGCGRDSPVELDKRRPWLHRTERRLRDCCWSTQMQERGGSRSRAARRLVLVPSGRAGLTRPRARLRLMRAAAPLVGGSAPVHAFQERPSVATSRARGERSAHCCVCLVATATVARAPSDGKLVRVDVVPMHRMRRVWPSGASVGCPCRQPSPARQQRVRRAPRRPHGGTAGWTPRVPEDGRGMPRACPGWW